MSTSVPIPARKRWLVALAALTVVVVLVAVDPTALCLLPAFALAVPLSMRRYPGEQLMVVLSRSGRRWAHPYSHAPHTRPAVVVFARGGLLLARSLAVRPPPAVSLAGS
jgi:hypothetical protein